MNDVRPRRPRRRSFQVQFSESMACVAARRCITLSDERTVDFLSASDAYETAQDLNRDLEEYCATAPAISPEVDSRGFKRLYGFGLLPLVPGISVEKIVDTVRQVEKLEHLRGVIIGTRGLGNGLDDPALEPVWEALQKARLVSFIHPHYGIGKEAWGNEQSHVLPLALGFPFETTIVRGAYSIIFVADPSRLLRA